LIIASISGLTESFKQGGWTKAIPSYPLVVLSTTSLGEHRTDIRREVITRVNDGSVTGRSAALLCDTLVKDLRDDDKRWNADVASRLLRQLWPDSKEALELETVAGDMQSRIKASRILRGLSETPSELLLTACVADLQDDHDLVDWYVGRWNANAAAVYLSNWWDFSQEYVHEAMYSDDAQQSFLAAAIAGFGGTKSHAAKAVSVLAPHLMDNNISGDSRVAAPALFNIGPEVIPFLRVELSRTDDQGRAILLHIIERLEYPERTYSQCLNPLPRITVMTHDPLSLTFRKALRRY
jgi:hypothetical protein